jgi:Conserved TM helix
MPNALAINANFGQGLQKLVDTIARAIPKIGVFVLILVVGGLVAWMLGRLVAKGLQGVGFTRIAERGAVGRALSRGRWDASTLAGKIVYYMIALFVLQMAFGVFGPNPVSVLLTAVIAWLPKALVAIAILVFASAIAKVVRDLIYNAIGGLAYGAFVAGAVSVLIVALGVIAALDQVSIGASVTEPVLIAGLATAGAIAAIGVGGGLVKPMQARWERILGSAERETVRQVAAYQRGRREAAARAAAAAERTPLEPSAVGDSEPPRDPGAPAGPGGSAGGSLGVGWPT